jgi:hypothetical protein
MARQVQRIPEINRYDCRKIAMEQYSDQKIASDYIKIYQ